ncbi:hypothetical protein [Paracoccus sp. N5]|uniref:hypothetical protein n=1 Tax=Paracoccus sp. N5 TaxID=1101189 RepID=UPI000365B2E9|nr:hypothetical protein [Paracoccus sp. N5]
MRKNIDDPSVEYLTPLFAGLPVALAAFPPEEEVTVSIAKLAMPDLTDSPDGLSWDVHVGPGVHPIYPVAYSGDGARLLSGMIAEFGASRIAAWFAARWDERMTLTPGDFDLEEEPDEDELYIQRELEVEAEHLDAMEGVGGFLEEDGDYWPESPMPNLPTRRYAGLSEDEVPHLNRTVH